MSADSPGPDFSSDLLGGDVDTSVLAAGARSYLGDLTCGDRDRRMDAYDVLDAFLAAKGIGASLQTWLGADTGSGSPTPTLRTVLHTLARDIAEIDELLNEQANAILQHPRFRRLEGSWRGLLYLVDQVYATRDRDTPEVKVKVLDVSWKSLARDLDRAIEFDQSQMYRKVYEEEFGTAGGEPFCALLGDYEVSHRPGPGHPTNDVSALTAISHVAAAAFAPFVAAAHPSLLGLDSFADLERPIDLERTFTQAEYARWKSLRKQSDARFVGILLPRVLARLPHEDDGSRADGFRFHEDTSAPDGSGYCWTTPVYAYGAVLVRSFADSGWLASIRGVPLSGVGGGVVSGLPVHSFATDERGVATKYSTEVLVTDTFEKEMSDHGMIALCPLKYTELSAFYGNASVQVHEQYDDEVANANAKLSSMLQYMFCCSQFAHYIKIFGRDRVGSLSTATECQNELQSWLMQYVTSNEGAGLETKARYPLREARVGVHEVPGKPGTYACTVHLRPHFQLDQAATAVRLVTELSPV